MKIAVLCTETTGFGCLDALRKTHEITGIGIPRLAADAMRPHQSFSQYSGLPLVILEKADLERDLIKWFGATKPDVLLVYGFPWRLPAGPLESLRHGGFNVHYGALPEFRGPQPVFWAVRQQAREIGITIHRLDSDWDTGPIAVRRSATAQIGDTLGLAMARLTGPATEASLELLQKLENGTLVTEPQAAGQARYWPRPSEKDLTIHWNNDGADSIAALVHAANPFHGGAIAKLRGNELRIWQIATGSLPGVPPAAGTIIAANPQQGLITVSRDGFWVRLDVVSIREGLFTGDDFVPRIGIRPGEKFESPA